MPRVIYVVLLSPLLRVQYAYLLQNMGVNSWLKIREEQSYQDLKHVDSGVERKNVRKLPFGDIHTISTAYILYTETDSCISKLSGAGCTVCIRVDAVLLF